jgi:hypothetical protein
LQVEGGGEVAGVWEFPRSRLRLQTVLGEGNFGKVRTFSPGKIGLKSSVLFQTVLGEGNFGKVRTFSPGKIELKSFVHFPIVLGKGNFGKVRDNVTG